jgi:aminoglycoside phosphotransferase (APT) family kinase protein
MFKDLSPRGLTNVARAAKPVFLYDPQREIHTYLELLAPARLGTATCFGAVADPVAGRYWLFLERVRGRELYQVGERDIWRQAARWLAGLHSRFAPQADALKRSAGLLIYDAAFYRLWPGRAVAFAEAAASPGDAARLRQLAAGYERVVERLLALPVTLLHGEFYASNVIVQETPIGTRVCPVDWEMTAVGPGLVDLAALTAGRWTDDERTDLALAYHAAYPPTDGWPPGPAKFLTALDVCRLHLAVQWLGWARNWSPPRDHVHDWLSDALTLAAKLGLSST